MDILFTANFLQSPIPILILVVSRIYNAMNSPKQTISGQSVLIIQDRLERVAGFASKQNKSEIIHNRYRGRRTARTPAAPEPGSRIRTATGGTKKPWKSEGEGRFSLGLAAKVKGGSGVNKPVLPKKWEWNMYIILVVINHV